MANYESALTFAFDEFDKVNIHSRDTSSWLLYYHV